MTLLTDCTLILEPNHRPQIGPDNHVREEYHLLGWALKRREYEEAASCPSESTRATPHQFLLKTKMTEIAMMLKIKTDLFIGCSQLLSAAEENLTADGKEGSSRRRSAFNPACTKYNRYSP